VHDRQADLAERLGDDLHETGMRGHPRIARRPVDEDDSGPNVPGSGEGCH
jgi:hypothetical protein